MTYFLSQTACFSHTPHLRSPVKLKSLVQEDTSSALTPRQKMELRKKQKADQEAEKRKSLAAKNLSERQERAKARKKQQVNDLSLILLHIRMFVIAAMNILYSFEVNFHSFYVICDVVYCIEE